MDLIETENQIVSSETAICYRKIVQNLLDTKHDWGTAQWRDEVCGYSLALTLDKSDIGLATFKKYVAAVRWVLIDNDLTLALNSFETTVLQLERPNQNRRTFLKHVPVDVSSNIIKMAYSRSAKFSRHLGLLLEATLATGLRPKEWADASLENDQNGFLLRVKNGKYVPPGVINIRSRITSARRGNGPFRELLFSGDFDQQQSLASVIDNLLILERSSPWLRVQKSLRRELATCIDILNRERVIESIFKNLTIYSFRHQAASDAKASLGTEEGKTAAVLGHASARTAVDSYGRRGFGKSGLKVFPSEASVLFVDNKKVPDPRAAIHQPLQTQIKIASTKPKQL